MLIPFEGKPIVDLWLVTIIFKVKYVVIIWSKILLFNDECLSMIKNAFLCDTLVWPLLGVAACLRTWKLVTSENYVVLILQEVFDIFIEWFPSLNPKKIHQNIFWKGGKDNVALCIMSNILCLSPRKHYSAGKNDALLYAWDSNPKA